ncbi:MAG: sensor histidine kinase [Lachnospiraceae bacterium]|nr:sensor histidine kinase [Lachnospiraceae bacterium]
MLFEENIIFLVLKVLITFAGTIGMMISTTDFRFVKRKFVSIVIFGIYSLYVVLSTYAIIYFLDYAHFLRVFLLTISCPAVFLLHNISDEPFPRLVFTRATHILISLYIAATVTLLNTALHGTELSDILLRLLIYLLIILFDFYFVRRIYLNLISTIRKGWGTLSLIPCAFIILAVTIAFYPEHYAKRPASIVMIYLLGAVIVIIYSAIGFYLSIQYHRLSAEQNREILEWQVQNIQRKTANIENLTEQTKIIRHDTRHMLSTIAALAENKDMQAILDFIKTTAKIPDLPESLHYCNDPLLDATLSSYLKSAEESGITLETSFSIPDHLPVDSAELAICFANALGNAIKCCEKLPEEERKIIVKCIYKPKLMFEIANPYKGKITFDRNNLPQSSESSIKIGIRSIIAFCEKHDAFYTFTAENGWFKVTVAL